MKFYISSLSQVSRDIKKQSQLSMSTITRPDFRYVLKTGTFFEVLRVSCVIQEFKFPPNFFGYLTDAVGAHQRNSYRSVLIFLIKFRVLCDWHLSIIRPHLYSLLPENTTKSWRFIVDILYI
jgi:hypothetical protein